MRWWFALLATAACGRLRFEVGELDGDASVTPPDQGIVDDLDTDPSLLFWYRFDDDLSDGPADSSPKKRDAGCGPAGCGMTGPGRVGPGAARIESMTHARVAFSQDLNTVNGFTISIWANLENPNAVSLMSKPFGTMIFNSWDIGTNLGTPVVCTSATGTQNECDTAGAAILPNTWVHYAATWDGAEKRLYIDGMSFGAFGGRTTMFDTSDILIGCDEEFGILEFCTTGLLDDARLYNRPLSDDEVAALAKRE